MRGRALGVALLGVALLAGACSRSHKDDDGTNPKARAELPALTVRDETPELMLTWIDERGEPHVEIHPADIPAAGRGLVRVVVADREDGTREFVYVADLTKKREDGAYSTTTMARREWEAEIERRREAYLVRTAPPRPPAAATGPAAPGPAAPGPDSPAPASSGGVVIIYGASWCGPCHQAANYLRSKGIPYVLKDIEETPGAQAEMRAKLDRAGRRGGSIPVIDVRGQILIGFSATELDRALAKAPAGTLL